MIASTMQDSLVTMLESPSNTKIQQLFNRAIQDERLYALAFCNSEGHLAKMIKERLPKATVITFWHIPFPNPEVFGVCSWREDIIDGLLGSSILGFHTKFHCHNFMDAVERFMEARIDKETSTISYKGNLTAVNHYPISIEYPVKWLQGQKSVPECREFIRKENRFPKDRMIGVGVDRLDYTKGILERFLAVERLLELEPQ